MNVRELYSIYESLNRDIDKLKATKSSIPADRDYTGLLQKTINSEIERYENLKKSLLEVEIDMQENVSYVEKFDEEEYEPTAPFVLMP